MSDGGPEAVGKRSRILMVPTGCLPRICQGPARRWGMCAADDSGLPGGLGVVGPGKRHGGRERGAAGHAVQVEYRLVGEYPPWRTCVARYTARPPRCRARRTGRAPPGRACRMRQHRLAASWNPRRSHLGG